MIYTYRWIEIDTYIEYKRRDLGAVKEITISSHNPETLFFSIYPYHGNLIGAPARLELEVVLRVGQQRDPEGVLHELAGVFVDLLQDSPWAPEGSCRDHLYCC